MKATEKQRKGEEVKTIGKRGSSSKKKNKGDQYRINSGEMGFKRGRSG